MRSKVKENWRDYDGVFVCVCVCVCVWERERERENKRQRERERVKIKVFADEQKKWEREIKRDSDRLIGWEDVRQSNRAKKKILKLLFV